MARSGRKQVSLREAALPRPAARLGVTTPLAEREPSAAQTPSAPPPPAEQAQPLPRALGWRLGWLALVLLLVHVWFQQNLGTSTQALVVASTGSAAVLSALGWVYGKKELEAGLRGAVRRRLDRSLTVPVLSAATLVVVVFGTLVTSVKVLSESAGGTLLVRVAPEGAAETDDGGGARVLEGPGGVASVFCLTAPLGRAFFADVSGYQRHSFDVYPWIGKRIRVERDLARAPSLLVRVPAPKQSLLPGGRIELWTRGERGERIGLCATSKDAGAALFGHRPPIPDSFVATWEREVLARELTGVGAARTILAWQRPGHAPTSQPLVPGMELTALFFGAGTPVGDASGVPSETPQASAPIVVGSQPLQDVLLGDPPKLAADGGER
ncbi:MAG TPA: hypothetical protein VMS76_04730 [Planctomycetota bacterium]|nr:hypothetical protein [Planctomycetota bacterium]